MANKDLTQRERDEINRIAVKHKVVNAKSMIKELLGTNFSEEERTDICESLKNSCSEIARDLLLRAFIEKDFTEKELEEWKKEGFEEHEFSTILGAFYTVKDEPCDDETMILTMSHSNIYKQRDKIEKRFGIKSVTMEEVMEIKMKCRDNTPQK